MKKIRVCPGVELHILQADDLAKRPNIPGRLDRIRLRVGSTSSAKFRWLSDTDARALAAALLDATGPGKWVTVRAFNGAAEPPSPPRFSWTPPPERGPRP